VNAFIDTISLLRIRAVAGWPDTKIAEMATRVEGVKPPQYRRPTARLNN